MDPREIKNEIARVLNLFGMSVSKAAEAMGITPQIFRYKMNKGGGDTHKFTESNLEKLKAYLRNAVKSLNFPAIKR